MNKDEAALLLGAKESEVAGVVETDDGVVISLVSGTRFIVVPEGSPDGEGKSGLMLFVAPNPDHPYVFPVFVPAEPEPDAEPEADNDGGDDAPVKAAPAKKAVKKAAAKKAAAPAADDDGGDDA